MFGLGDNKNARTAEPSEVRAYPAKADGTTADRIKGPLWIGSKSSPEYKLQDKEVAVYHGAIDISSRGPDGKPVEREFTAGVYGTVLASRPGFVAVQMPDGNVVQYLHASNVRLKPGQDVKPDTILGETGNLGTSGKPIGGMPVHLHIQVTNPKGQLMDPDRAILAGRAEKQDRTIRWVKPDWVDVGPMLIVTNSSSSKLASSEPVTQTKSPLTFTAKPTSVPDLETPIIKPAVLNKVARPSKPTTVAEGMQWTLDEMHDYLVASGLEIVAAKRMESFAHIPGLWLSPVEGNGAGVLVERFPDVAGAKRELAQKSKSEQGFVWGKFLFVGRQGPLFQRIRHSCDDGRRKGGMA